ncbi:phosphatase PAP2 family protein [Bacillus tianshenii]|uniref:phosphatase PAP2 family protein n=1 Tax=Sutcliffiella tianshenii TaxID=1463404 RepID=UPI001CD1B162|nr:phosphatase PAP2 family protein [Bacillus tianshenii]MCA1319540.1 phosphatase PAP2 family protein [Bacillus tianshenii]
MNIQAKYLFLCSFLFILLFLLLGFLLEFQTVENLDERWGRMWYQFLKADSFFIFMSFIGSRNFLYPVMILVTIFLLVKRYYFAVMVVWVNILGVRLLNTLIKGIFQRERPSLDHIVDVHFYSFPSGHAMNSMAAYGMLALLFLLIVRNRVIKILTVVIASILILLIGTSRIYLGVHFPLDVFAGYLAGAAWLTFLIGIWKKLRSESKERKYM